MKFLFQQILTQLVQINILLEFKWPVNSEALKISRRTNYVLKESLISDSYIEENNITKIYPKKTPPVAY